MQGRAKLKYEDNEYILEEGDSVSFPASCPHVVENIGKNELIAFWGVTPPQRFLDK